MDEFEYKEVIRKDGTTLIFCNFEELLTKYYGVKTMAEVESHAGDNGEYIIHCPFCKKEGHTKHKLYIKSDLTVGHCFVCGRTYIHVSDKLEFRVNVPESILKFGFGSEPFNVVKLTDPDWSLDRLQYEFEDFDKTGYDYLCSRHKYMKDLYQKLGFKFWYGNIIMPFFYHGEPIYYQIRFSNVGHDDKGIRYYFPQISKKPVYIIDHGRGIRKLILCEGIFDAVSLLIQAPDYIPIALMGSSLNDYQIGFIKEYMPEKILIYMDETSISRRVMNKLKTRIDYCPIDIIRSDGEDPEERMNRMIATCPGSEVGWISRKYNNKKFNIGRVVKPEFIC